MAGRLLALAVLLALLAYLPARADGEPIDPEPVMAAQAGEFMRFESRCITHDGTPELDTTLSEWEAHTLGAVRNCGWSQAPDISAEVIPDYVHRGSASAATDALTGYTSWCRVRIRVATDVGAWRHEVGHCLGHWFHVEQPPSIMEPDGGNQVLTEYDRAWVRELYGVPPLWRLVAPQVARD